MSAGKGSLPAEPPKRKVERSRKILGAERATLAKDLGKRYYNGESIRILAASVGRSYGFIRRILVESGVQLRDRGGDQRGRRNGSGPA